ncbi:ZIP family metal transporter [Adlercreutzia sp. R7]|uniref:ZIP family metal transporter n=1 Tax=Adlercreutzia wanghongyangiae TaxID=3111451 RepID=A0ABU6II88_9ACTN|nr:ZIP family metal transporter [Adlercreutzia sp. R7]
MEGSVVVGVVVALAVPFLGNTLGAALVFLMRHGMSERFTKALLGFAAGVMIAASVWSLIMPALAAAEDSGLPAWLPATVGFLGGMFLLLAIDHFTPHLHVGSDEPEGPASTLKKPAMMMAALAIHNLPEGMAVGVVLAGFLAGDSTIALAAVVALSIGIAIQNVPEGAIVSLPLVANGLSRPRAFAAGALCGAVEPVGALLMLAITGLVTPLLPYVLAFAAGAMMYVVTEELIPQTQQGRHANIGTIGVAFGFVLMMILDVALG